MYTLYSDLHKKNFSVIFIEFNFFKQKYKGENFQELIFPSN